MLYITFTSRITGAQSKLQDAKVAFGTNQLLPTWLLGWVGVQGGVKISMESSIKSLRAFDWLTCQNKVQSHSRSSLLVTNTEILSAKCYLGLMFLCYLSVGAEPDHFLLLSFMFTFPPVECKLVVYYYLNKIILG